MVLLMSDTILVNKQSLEEVLEENRKFRVELKACHERIASLEDEVKTLRRKIFGKKSERLPKKQDHDQVVSSDLSLSAEDKKILQSLLDAEPIPNASASPSKPSNDNLEYERVDIDLSEKDKFCQLCSNPLHRIGEQSSKQLDYIIPKLKLRETIRYKYGCRHCETAVTIPAKPGRTKKQLKASPGLLAYLIVAKYADHLPLYRLEGIFKRQGYRIARSTLSDWLQQSGKILAEHVFKIKSHVLTGAKINTDDTVLPVQDRTLKGRTRIGRMWVYRNEKGCVYEYTINRSREGPSGFLKDYHGIIQADGYSGYNECCRTNGILRSACWAHVRRKFYDVAQLSSEPGKPDVALAYIQRLYAVEKQICDMSDNEKVIYRQRLSKPIIGEFCQWLKHQLSKTLPKSHFAKAIRYALNFWSELILYCEYGFLDIDNNAAERAMRPVALGRKNWLFAGSNKGGETAAVMLSLIETAKQKGLNAISFITDLLSGKNYDEIVGCV